MATVESTDAPVPLKVLTNTVVTAFVNEETPVAEIECDLKCLATAESTDAPVAEIENERKNFANLENVIDPVPPKDSDKRNDVTVERTELPVAVNDKDFSVVDPPTEGSIKLGLLTLARGYLTQYVSFLTTS